MKIMKFGGASLADAQKILHVAGVIKNFASEEKIVVVVSAFFGVTDCLISIYHHFETGRFESGLKELQQLYDFHFAIAKDLHERRNSTCSFYESLSLLFAQLTAYLTFHRKYSQESYDHIVSFGERISSVFVACALQNLGVGAKSVESSKVIVTTDEFGNARALLPQTRERAERILIPILLRGVIPVFTGYFGATADGRVATFGRGGSDYSATVLAYALDAQEVILWKEVDGIFTSDPKLKKNAAFISEISYRKAAQMAKNGAKILHPDAMEPAVNKKIIIWVKNTFHPEAIGTKIW